MYAYWVDCLDFRGETLGVDEGDDDDDLGGLMMGGGAGGHGDRGSRRHANFPVHLGVASVDPTTDRGTFIRGRSLFDRALESVTPPPPNDDDDDGGEVDGDGNETAEPEGGRESWRGRLRQTLLSKLRRILSPRRQAHTVH